VFSDPIYSFLGEQEGIYAPIEYESFENLSNIYPIARMSDATVIHDMGAYGLAYNPDQVADPPTSWNDLWDDRFDGKVSIRGFRPDTIELMVWAAKQNGGDERNIDPGFEKMEELAPRVQTFFGEHTELLNLFQTDAVDVAMWTGGRVGWAQDQGADVEWVAPAEGPFALVSTMNIVNGTGNEDLAQAYINHELSVESGTNMADKLGYFPTNSTIVLPPDVQARVDFTPETIEDVQMADWAYIVTVIDDWRHRWETEVIN